MITFNGSWGHATHLFKDQSEPVALGVEHVTRILKDHPFVEALWASLTEHIFGLKKLVGAEDHAHSLEVCPTTLKRGDVRLHLHAFFVHASRRLKNLDLARSACFRGVAPYKSPFDLPRGNRSRWSGMYYIVSPKIGQIFKHSSKEPFKQFPVDGDWIFNLLSQEKIYIEEARVQLFRTTKNLVRRMADFEKYRELQEQYRLEAHVERVQAHMHFQKRPQIRLPQVEAFLRKYVKNREPVARKKILVLDGPSGVGKTEFVRSLFTSGSLLELNAGDMKTVCLPGFNQSNTRAILWDECRSVLVARNRKIFQHGCCWVDIGHSPTAQHVRRVYLNDCVSIVASNRWNEDVAAMSSVSDQEWLRKNTVVVFCVRPLWKE